MVPMVMSVVCSSAAHSALPRTRFEVLRTRNNARLAHLKEAVLGIQWESEFSAASRL